MRKESLQLPSLLTIEEVAEQLQVSKAVVYRLVRKGELLAYHLRGGEDIYIPFQSLDGYLQRRVGRIVFSVRTDAKKKKMGITNLYQMLKKKLCGNQKEEYYQLSPDAEDEDEDEEDDEWEL